jgi:hypothetical protein
MNITEALYEANKKPTLAAALSYMAIWDMERIVKYVRENEGTWDSCFGTCFEPVLVHWAQRLEEERRRDHYRCRCGVYLIVNSDENGPHWKISAHQYTAREIKTAAIYSCPACEGRDSVERDHFLKG